MAWLQAISSVVETVSNTLGVLTAGLGLFHMCWEIGREAFAGRPVPGRRAQIVLGRWLLLSLELTLATDVVVTLVAPMWDEIGKLAAMIVLRTTLNYFLAKEMEGASLPDDVRVGSGGSGGQA
jgi:uncharacterized membrane protein